MSSSVDTEPPTKKNRLSATTSSMASAESAGAAAAAAAAASAPERSVHRPAPPAPLAKNIDRASSQWRSLNDSVVLLRKMHTERNEMVEKAKAASVELKSLNQAVETSLRLGRPLDGVLQEVAAVRDVLLARSAALTEDCGGDAALRSSYFISNTFSQAVAQCLMGHFLQTGMLLPFKGGAASAHFAHLLPSEYLIGVMHFTKLVEHYAVGRAIAGDEESISICRQLIEAILEQLLQFDFRNGPLRRNYDGVKYVNKRLQDMSYDLSLVNFNGASTSSDTDASASGSSSSSSSSSSSTSSSSSGVQVAAVLTPDDIEAIRTEIAAADLARDNVIKQCRDMQKAAKNAIFALHRGESSYAKSIEMIAGAASKGLVIYDSVMGAYKENRFRGSFPSAMEEWAEAALFAHWLQTGTILSFGDLEKLFNASHDETEARASGKWVEGTIAEYVGGLVDLTGEIGRWAIAKATQRDSEAVATAMEADLMVQSIFLELTDGEDGVSGLGKKKQELDRNINKVQQIIYDLALAERRRNAGTVVAATE